MSEQLQSKLVEILSGIQSAVQSGGDFVLSQLPDIAQQYVIYGRLSETVYSVAMLVASIAAAIVALKFGLLSKEVDKWGEWTETRAGATILGGVTSLACLLVFFMTLSSTLLVWAAPKVWLLKEIAKLVK